MKCNRCGRLMKEVGFYRNDGVSARGFVCPCRNYCIVHTTRDKKATVNWGPDMTLMGTVPVHREILDELRRLGRAGLK